MNNKIIFLNDPWLWPTVASALLLLIVFVWKELAVSRRRRLILRLILSLFAIGALVLIALVPALPTSRTAGSVILLTLGHEMRQVDSLKKEYPGIKVLDYSSQQMIPDDIYKAEVVFILGYGLKEYELEEIKNIPAIHLPGRVPGGVVKVRFPYKSYVGDNINLRGFYRWPSPGNWMVLEGPGGILFDSIELNDEEQQHFNLVSELKAAGNFVYYLTEKNTDGEIITRDPVPVQVEEKEGLRILIINNFPTFETKYLKNFLAEAGHGLVVRSQITSGRFKYEYLNTGRTIIGSLSRETLEPYDLLIIDAASLRGLAGNQLHAIENAAKEDGLGVFVQPDETFFNSPGSLINLQFERQSRSNITLKEWPGTDLSIFPFSLISSTEQESIYEEGNLIIAGYNRRGQGRVGSTVLSDTWHLVLEGNLEVYRELWSQMITHVSKRDETPFQFEQQGQVAFPNEPFHFKIKSDKPDVIITKPNGRVIPLVQEINLAEQWKGTLWPRERGWHQLQHDTTAVFNYYVAGEGSWRALNAQETLDINQRFIEETAGTGGELSTWEPINLIWFYGLFLICMGGLWLEPKLV